MIYDDIFSHNISVLSEYENFHLPNVKNVNITFMLVTLKHVFQFHMTFLMSIVVRNYRIVLNIDLKNKLACRKIELTQEQNVNIF